MRRKKLYLNTIVALFCQIITIVYGFVLPRLMLSAYGSTVNGVVSSISQFLGVISFMQLGVGAVVQSSFYEPLVKNDVNKISEIYKSASKFFRTIAIIFVIYVVGLTLVYPRTVALQFDYWFSASLIIILSISLFAQYFFGLTNQLLLYADQKAYIPMVIDALTTLVNTVIAIVLIRLNYSVQIVKIVSSLIFLFRPFALAFYVRKHYCINRLISYENEPIKQKWNGFAQHLASTVMDNTDVMILTVFSSLNNVSIYYVYNIVVFGIRQVISSVTVGIQSFFGNLLVQSNKMEVKNTFEIMEIGLHYIITVLFASVFILLVSFVGVYTKGIEDANYFTPVFAGVITLAQAIYCYRLLYYIIIKAAGHYKETQKSAIIEMVINIIASVIGVVHFGLVGVAIGTFLAVLYRMIYFILYLKANIIMINLKKTVTRLMTDVLIIYCSKIWSCSLNMVCNNYLEWFYLAIKVFLICATTTSMLNVIVLSMFDINQFKAIIRKILRK